MSIDSIQSTSRAIVAPPGAVAGRPLDDDYKVSRREDFVDRGFNSLFLGGLSAAIFGGVSGAGTAMLTGSGRRGLAVGAAVGAVLLTGGLVGAARSQGTRHEADPESVALAWLPTDGDPKGPSDPVSVTHPRSLASLHVDAGSARQHVRRAQMIVAEREGTGRAFGEQADAIAHARRTPGDQAVVRYDEPVAGRQRWLVTNLDVVAKAGQDSPQHGYYSRFERPELLVPPGAAPDRDLRVPVEEWLASTPYGIEAVESFASREKMPLIELGGKELVPATSTTPHDLTMPDTYLVGRPD